MNQALSYENIKNLYNGVYFSVKNADNELLNKTLSSLNDGKNTPIYIALTAYSNLAEGDITYVLTKTVGFINEFYKEIPVTPGTDYYEALFDKANVLINDEVEKGNNNLVKYEKNLLMAILSEIEKKVS